MAFTEKKFKSLSRFNQTKKLAYAIREQLHGNNDFEEASIWFEWYSDETLGGVPQNRDGWIVICEKLLQHLEDNSEYIEESPFDTVDNIRNCGDVVVLLDNIRAPYNVGAILRSAEAFGLKSAILAGITPGLDNSKVVRTSMKAPIPVEHAESSVEVIKYYKEMGYTVIALEKSSVSVSIVDFATLNVARRRLIILGNEEFGISDELLDLSDYQFHIDLQGIKNSLNVSVAAGVLFYEMSK